MENVFFKRRDSTSPECFIDRSLFNAIMGLCLLFGFAVNVLEILYLRAFAIGLDPVLFLLMYFASAFFGIWLAKESDEPDISFIGYCFVVLPVGLVLSIVVPEYSFEIIRNAIVLTSMVTAVMCIAGVRYPKFFSRLGRVLCLSLFALIVVELICIFFGFFQCFELLDFIGAGIFSFCVGYDYYRAQQVPATVDNAINCSVGLYLDIINLFLRLLRILGRKK